MCINSCPTTSRWRELSVDLEGVKLEQVISQNDIIKVNTYNVGMLSDVVIDLKKQIHVMQEKLDNYVVSTNLYSKVVNCSNQTINTHYNKCDNNAKQRLNESPEYIANCRSTTQFQNSKYEDKSTNSEDISREMSRVIVDASLSSPSQSEDGNANSVVGFSEENSMRYSQPCHFNEFSGNSLQSCVSGNHGIKQNNNPIPTRVARLLHF